MVQGFLDRLDRLEVLTGTSLGELVEALREEEKQLQASVFRQLLDTFETETDDGQLSSVVDALSIMLSDCETGGGLTDLHSLVVEYREALHEISGVERELHSKQFQLNLQEQQDTFRQMRDRGCFSEAAWNLIGMQRTIQDHVSSTEDGGALTEQDRQRIEAVGVLDADMKTALVDTFEHRFWIDLAERELQIRRSDNEDGFSEMWKAAEILNLIDVILPRLTERIAALIDSAILGDDIFSCRLTLSAETTDDRMTLTWNEDPCQDPVEAVESRSKALLQLMEFHCRVLLCNMHSLCGRLGNELWPNLQPVLSSKVLDIENRLEEDQRLMYLESTYKEACLLENGLKGINFLQDGDTALSSAICAASKAAFHKYSEQYVKDARDVMVSPNWDAVTVGKDPVLDRKSIQYHAVERSEAVTVHGLDLLRSPIGRGSYQITETASRIRQIIEAVATEGFSKGILVMQSLVQGIRDICFAYNCMFPVLHGKELDVPQLGLLTVNDCSYLSDEMLLLPLTVPNFRSMAPDVHFKEEAEAFLTTGQRILANQVRLQSGVFREVLSGVDDFGSLKTGQQGIALRKATNQIVRMLHQLGKVLGEVLSLTDRCNVAAAVAEAIAKPILTKLMSRTDVSSQESHELPVLVHGLIEEIPSMLLHLPKEICRSDRMASPSAAVSKEGDISMEQFLSQRFSQGCRNLKKLRRLLRIWDAKLNQIVEWWTIGALMEDGFTAEDVRNLVWALFEHSDKREDAVAIITGTG